MPIRKMVEVPFFAYLADRDPRNGESPANRAAVRAWQDGNPELVSRSRVPITYPANLSGARFLTASVLRTLAHSRRCCAIRHYRGES